MGKMAANSRATAPRTKAPAELSEAGACARNRSPISAATAAAPSVARPKAPKTISTAASLAIPIGSAFRISTGMAVSNTAPTPSKNERQGVPAARTLARPTISGKSSQDPVSRPGKAIPRAKSVPKTA